MSGSNKPGEFARDIRGEQRRNGIADLPVSGVGWAAVHPARKLTTARVCGEDEAIRERLEAGEFSNAQRPRKTVVIDGVGFRIKRPGPDVGMQAAIGREM
jgi:hypothetical protein